MGAGLPTWPAALAVVAHPDDESFGLGAILAAFAEAGTRTAVLCFTHGEASTVHGVDGDLYRVRAAELEAAARVLGVTATTLLSYPDGALASIRERALVGEVIAAARGFGADGLLAFDSSGVTGHVDHAAASEAAVVAGAALDLPVLGWTLPRDVAAGLNAEYGTSFAGHAARDIDHVIAVDRERQRAAIAMHSSQAVPASVVWRRLELLGRTEHLRRLWRVSSRE